MLYPAFVELGDKNRAYGVVLPDFPGCFSAADEMNDLPARVQEAVELYFEGGGFAAAAAFRFGDSTYAAGICL